MKVSDYIIKYLIDKGITDIFGYPGGMVTQLMDSFARHSDRIAAHVTYHEQAAAFAACGYAQTTGKPGVAYATSGPGATNLITGTANAYFDSIPTIFLTGQVNRNEAKGKYAVRQRGFQETDIVSIAKSVTKHAAYIADAGSLPYELDRAYHIAMEGRRGPVLLDIPMDVFKAEIEEKNDSVKIQYVRRETGNCQAIGTAIKKALNASKASLFLIGGGVKAMGLEERIRIVLSRLRIPVVSSMIAFDVMKGAPNYYGFIGAYGSRTANFIAAKSDLIISIGSRLDIRQVGARRSNFAPNARIIRCDIDEGELAYRVHEDETTICAEIGIVVKALEQMECDRDHSSWIAVCDEIKELLSGLDADHISRMIGRLSCQIPGDAVITTDVGQSQVWTAQSFRVKEGQKVLFSGDHGAMGYALPAAIGAYYGSGKKPVYCITGDGGLQMNIQELQFIARECLSIKIIVLNNNALGMIRHFQEMYFGKRYFQTKPEGGYSSPDFVRIAGAYGIPGHYMETDDTIGLSRIDGAELIEVGIKEDTYVTPKLAFGNPNQDQEPLIDRELYERIMRMKPQEAKRTDIGGYYLRSIIGFSALPARRCGRRWAA